MKVPLIDEEDEVGIEQAKSSLMSKLNSPFL
jgi:hypothetical protein